MDTSKNEMLFAERDGKSFALGDRAEEMRALVPTSGPATASEFVCGERATKLAGPNVKELHVVDVYANVAFVGGQRLVDCPAAQAGVPVTTTSQTVGPFAEEHVTI